MNNFLKLVVATVVLFASKATKAQGTWVCGQYISRQVANPASPGNLQTQFVQVTTNATGSVVTTAVKASNTAHLINSTVFYGGYIWGWKQYPGTIQENDGSLLLKIANDGSVVQTFDPSSPDLNGQYNSAFVDENGIYYVATNSTTNTITLSRIDLKPATPVQLSNVVITLPTGYNTASNVNAGDFVVSNGQVYLWINSRGLSSFPLPAASATTGTAVTVPAAGFAPTVRTVGSLFINAGDPNTIFGYGSTTTATLQDRLLKINKITGVVTELDSDASVSQSDGCGCPFETFVILDSTINSDKDPVIDAEDNDSDNDGVPDIIECPVVTTQADGLTQIKGSNSADLQLGDELLKTNAITYLGTNYDATIRIASKSGTVSLQGGVLAVTGAPNTNPYVTYTVTFVVSGSATTTNPEGIPKTLRNVLLQMFDIDGLGNTVSMVEVAGVLTSVPKALIELGSNAVDVTTLAGTNQGFLTTGTNTPPPGFTTIRPNTIPAINAASTDTAYSFIASYDALTSTQMIYGFTGTSPTVTTRPQALSFVTYWRCDTDGDGIPNILDLDSDGDGCYDSFESGATNNPYDSVLATTAVDGNGIPLVVLATPNQYPPALNYTPTYANATNTSSKACKVTIAGTVFNDANGTTNMLVDGTPTDGTPSGTSGNLFISLVKNGVVVATVPVADDGSYIFPDVYIETNYDLVLHTTAAGSLTHTLPTNYVITGEGPTSAGDLNTNGLINTLPVARANVNNVNFGINQYPESNDQTALVTILYGYRIPLIGGVNGTQTLKGSDPEDGPNYTETTDVKITQLPTNGKLFYNGVQVALNDIITDYDPLLLAYRWDSNPSATSDNFKFATVDAAGVVDPTPATYTLNFTTILPVHLISFTASSSNCTINLNWKSAEEQNFAYYEVEVSKDGTQFNTLQKIKALGNNSQYEASINNEKGKTYIRLKMVDKNGSFEYSPTKYITILCNEIGSITMYPNPATSILNLQMNVQAGKYTIALINALGSTVLTHSQATTQGAVIELKNLDKLAKGFYYVRVSQANGDTFYKKIMIK
jgi:hypothetical protein